MPNYTNDSRNIFSSRRQNRNNTTNNYDLLFLHMQNINSLCNIINETNTHLTNIHYERNRNHLRSRYSQASSQTNSDNFIENMIHSFIHTPLNENNSSRNLFPSMQFRFDQTIIPNHDTSNNLIQRNIDISENVYNIDNSNTLIDISNEIIDISNHYLLYNVNEYSYIPNPLNDICPITRERFYNNQDVYMIKKCKHIFNKSALTRWFTTNNTCPNCRETIF